MRLPWRKKPPTIIGGVTRLRLEPDDILVVVGARVLRDDADAPLNPFAGVIPNRVVMFEEPHVDLIALARDGSVRTTGAADIR